MKECTGRRWANPPLRFHSPSVRIGLRGWISRHNSKYVLPEFPALVLELRFPEGKLRPGKMVLSGTLIRRWAYLKGCPPPGFCQNIFFEEGEGRGGRKKQRRVGTFDSDPFAKNFHLFKVHSLIFVDKKETNENIIFIYRWCLRCK